MGSSRRELESGLVECPLELGPHLRMQFLGQPEGAAGVSPARTRAGTSCLNHDRVVAARRQGSRPKGILLSSSNNV